MSQDKLKEIKVDFDGIVGEPDFNMPKAKIELAKYVLAALFFLVVLLFACSFIPDCFVTERAKKLSENIYQSLVPIVSMILGYYFAKD
jgi:branched-subunit amino acid transport protein